MKSNFLVIVFMIITFFLRSQDIIDQPVGVANFDKKAILKKGNQWGSFSKSVIYPQNARENNIQGTVVLSFKITKDGNIIDITPIEYPNKELADNSIKSLQSTAWLWNPTILNNEPIDYNYKIAYIYAIYLDSYPPEYFKRANNYFFKGNYKKALKFYNKEIKYNEFNIEVYLKRALTKEKLGDSNGSLEDILLYKEKYNEYIDCVMVHSIAITRAKTRVN